jgi:hypothetical protein
MSNIRRLVWVLGTLVLAVHAASASPRPTPQNEPPLKEPTSIVITFKDGHQEKFAMAEIARIEYRECGRAHSGTGSFSG